MSSQASNSSAGWVRRIVIVEDNNELREMLAELLAGSGHDVHVAANGRQALTVIADAAPDVALIDIGLPDLDGCEVARRIRADGAAGRDVRLVALTGHSTGEDRRQALEAGFDDFLVKPVEAARLLELLAR